MAREGVICGPIAVRTGTRAAGPDAIAITVDASALRPRTAAWSGSGSSAKNRITLWPRSFSSLASKPTRRALPSQAEYHCRPVRSEVRISASSNRTRGLRSVMGRMSLLR